MQHDDTFCLHFFFLISFFFFSCAQKILFFLHFPLMYFPNIQNGDWKTLHIRSWIKKSLRVGGERKSHPLFVTSILFNSHTLLFPSTLIPLIPFLSPLPPRFFVYSPHTVYFYFVLTLFLLVSIHRVCTALLLLGYYVIFFPWLWMWVAKIFHRSWNCSCCLF